MNLGYNYEKQGCVYPVGEKIKMQVYIKFKKQKGLEMPQEMNTYLHVLVFCGMER